MSLARLQQQLQRRRSNRRKKQAATERHLRPEDFDDVQYGVEVVRLAESARNVAVDRANERIELVESAFVWIIGALVLLATIAVGIIATDTTVSMARNALWYIVPMLLIPIVWFVVLHLWEKHFLSPVPPTSTSSSKSKSSVGSFGAGRGSKIGIF